MTTERGQRQAETRAVTAYLNALQAPKPRQTREAMVKRRADVEAKLQAADRPVVERVRLVQQRMDLDVALAQLEDVGRLERLEEAFCKVVGGWAERQGISKEALREVGVSAAVLKRAGM